ncbi:bacillithiol biosynthesis cysteine-adding enzyme BshC [Flavobacterium litorale]|uniref:Putative cysteine ligase BshC n=1 Tax=Flavobacterium litorale TaxID=2856519 RepID=A0ABX8VAW1_9FLAO|nr:bacillithiol biosynthesis cysteine-adding enzyme BshC [Flavobacterium litorale]QYJ68338.1 bacillithiol biosynthesis cysteine-adding enzyme BshC [Flavobacterium litorale]
MPSDCISYQNSGYFTPLIVDYLNQTANLKPLYHRFPTLQNFKAQIAEKQNSYPAAFREVLSNTVASQYKGVTTSEATQNNIALLKKDTTFTITTGHQLNLFTGPLYFLYKIVSTINLSRQLKTEYPEYDFVPVYWMATEDHDFEEINYFNFRDKKIQWQTDSFGPVGRLNTEGLDSVLEAFSKELGMGNNADTLRNLFDSAYTKHNNLADATRYLANELFGNEGLVILDADNTELKKLFIPHIKNELLHQVSRSKVAETTEKLSEYNVQVNPREINLFYIEDNLRERIIFEEDKYHINNTELQFTEDEMLEVLEKHPEKFSPNVIMRPLYQEVLLPNLCYIGGGGEIAYWLELKSFFDASGVVFPILLLRNSVLLVTAKQANKLDKLNLSWGDVFLKQQQLMNNKVAKFSEFSLDFSEQKKFLEQQFKKLNEMATKTDASFTGAVKAQEKKQLKGLANLEKRLLKAEKRIYADKLERIAQLQDALFPSQSLQERKANFAEFYLEYDQKLMDELFKKLQPLEQEFSVIVL